MSILTIAHLALAILLFYIVNWIGAHSTSYGYVQLTLFVERERSPAFNFILKALTPSVYIILVATGLYILKLDKFVSGIWIVSVYYFGFRLTYNLTLQRTALLNWWSVLLQSAVGIGSAYLAYQHLVLPRHPLFPDLNSIGNQLWVIVALFIYATLNSVQRSDAASTRRKNRYISRRFNILRDEYGDLIKDQFPSRYMELVVYAVLIYETFNRPSIVRAVERIIFPWGSHTIGPMQVHTETPISDRKSVAMGVSEIRKCFEMTNEEVSGKKVTRYDIIRCALAKYNRDQNYINELFRLLHILWAQIAPEYRTDFEHMHMYQPIQNATEPPKVQAERT